MHKELENQYKDDYDYEEEEDQLDERLFSALIDDVPFESLERQY